MTEALEELKHELTKKVQYYEETLVCLSDKDEKKVTVTELLKKTSMQLHDLSVILQEKKGDAQNLTEHSVKCDDTIQQQTSSHISGGDGTIRSILILMAMEQEAKPFLERHKLKENNPSPFEVGSPMISYSGKLKTISGDDVLLHLVWNGKCQIHSCNLVATTAAGVAAYAALQVFQPDLVISAGTAGGFGELGACIGDVYVSTKCIFHARRIPICVPDKNFRYKDKIFEEYGFGHFRSPPLNGLAKAIGVKQGIVSSSDCLDCSDIDLQLLRSEGAVVKEMEAAAVAWVCQVLGKPFFALKSITDIVDGAMESEKEFYLNLMLASNNLQEKLTLAAKHLGGINLSKMKSVRQLNDIPKIIPLDVQRKKEQESECSHLGGGGDATLPHYTISISKGMIHRFSMMLLFAACGSCLLLYNKRNK